MNVSGKAPKTPTFWLALLPCVLAVAFFGWMKLGIYHDRLFPLTAALPLLLCLWNRSKLLLYGMSIALTVVIFIKVFVMLPPTAFTVVREEVLLVSQLSDVWLVAFVIHAILNFRIRLETKRRRLEALNAELEERNEELVAREEEISRQNEELQSQTEELEQQSEELRQQAEELEQQGAHHQELNSELLRREKGLEILLHSGRWMRSDMSEAYVMSGVCQAALQILPDEATAADVVAAHEGAYTVWGDCGFGLQGRLDDDLRFEQTFAALVVQSGRTAAIEDLRQRADLRLPALRGGRPFLAVLASPIWYEDKIVAALCIYSTEARTWTDHDFSVTEWLASQAALALQSIRVQAELQARRRDAENAALQKSQFLAAVSHDVRTPANAISLLAELIERASADPGLSHRVPELARSLWTNARSLIDLVSDVLDLTRLDTGVGGLHVTEFHLHEVIDAEVSQAETAARGKGLTIAKVLPAEPVKLTTDRTKLKRVIANLLSNAVKFTEQGGVRVECEVGDDVRVSIIDTGVGIPGDSLDKVFDEFFQLRNPERNRDKGAGLGLAICRRLVSNLDCTLTLESIPGVGSTFTLIIPKQIIAKPVLTADEAPSEPTASCGRLRGTRILLVEDNDVARAAVEELLASEGAAVTAVEDGGSAIACLTTGEFDVLLLDLNLPDMDGSEILQKLASSRPDSLRRILVISGDARPERYAQVKQFGADELLAKPVSLARIRSAILAVEESQNGFSTTT